jgi:DNA-directed RNA polymerase I and III subunit RPAC1
LLLQVWRLLSIQLCTCLNKHFFVIISCVCLLLQVRRLLEQDKWAEAIQLRKRKDHFIFTIESTGCIPAEELFRMALDILAAKCDKLAARL